MFLLSSYKNFILNRYPSSVHHISKYIFNFAHLSVSTVNHIRKKKMLSMKDSPDFAFPKQHWLLLCNAQSLFHKLDELRALITALRPNYVCVTETWFTPDIEDSLIQIPGYISFRNDRQDNSCDNRRGGGTMIYASTNVRAQSIELPSECEKPAGIECNLIRLHDPNTSYLLCAYVPPGLYVEIFNRFRQFVADVLDFLLQITPEANLYLCGDFNRYDFSFLNRDFSLENIVHVPTFQSATLDKFFCDIHSVSNFCVQSSPPLGSAVNAHNVLVISRYVRKPCQNASFHKVYDLRKSNVTAFCSRIAKTDWSIFSKFNHVNDCVDYFYECFFRAMSTIPVSYVKTTPNTKPWITPVLLDLINKRWQAYRRKDFLLYNHYKRKVKIEICKSKTIWSKKMLSSSRGVWSVVKEARGKNDSNSVNQFVSLFPDVFQAADYANKLFSSYFHNDDSCQVFSTPSCNDVEICDRVTVHDLLLKLKTDKAMGSDHVPPVLLKASASDICRPLSFIYNFSFNTACVPDAWKKADVVPLPKISPVVKDQLRPISLLPIVSKVFEKIILRKHFDIFMSGYDVHQFAYRKKSSTVCALLAIHEFILNFLDDPNVGGVRVITFDMSRAFDSVPHNILLERLSALPSLESDFLSRWIRSYLCDRQQRVRLGDTLSSFSHVTSGVPQGSLLGPYLFAIFMSTYCSFDSRVHIVKYADDVTVIIPVYKLRFDDISLVVQEVENFKTWCNSNFMTINCDKTKVLNISVSIDPLSSVPFLNNVAELKILGLFFNDRLTWTNHFDFILSKLSRRLYVLRVLKPLFPHDNLVAVFNAIIRSVIDYSSAVFVNPGKVLDSRLVRLCIRAYKIIHGTLKNCQYCNMTDVIQRRHMLAMSLFVKVLNDHNHLLYPLIPKVSERSNRIILPHVKTIRKVNAFFFFCSMMYNDSL